MFITNPESPSFYYRISPLILKYCPFRISFHCHFSWICISVDYALVWFGFFWFGLNWIGLDWFGLVWFSILWCYRMYHLFPSPCCVFSTNDQSGIYSGKYKLLAHVHLTKIGLEPFIRPRRLIVWRVEAQNGPEVKVDYIRSPVVAYCWGGLDHPSCVT